MTMPEFVIETAGLTKYFGPKKAVDTLTLRVPRGSVFAFLGRNGSGKTTTIRMLLGLLRPTRGSSSILGADSQALTPGTRARIGYMAESHAAIDWMTVAQAGYFQSRLYPTWNTKLFRSVIDHFALSPDTRVRTLSRGERAGLSLALTLAPQPEVLILDDPALGLDPVARRTLLETMLYVTRSAGRTILFSSHLLDDVERVADYVAVLDRSVLRAIGSIEDLAAAMRQYQLRFPPGGMPATLPPIRGLLSSRRLGDVLTIIVVRPDDDTRGVIASLQPMSVHDEPVAFPDAMVAWLGMRAEYRGFIDDAALSVAGGA